MLKRGIQNLKNTSATWNAFAVEKQDALATSQKQAQDVYKSIPINVQGDDFIKAMQGVVSQDKLGSMHIDPNSWSLGVNQMPPPVDYDSKVKELAVNPIMATPIGTIGKDVLVDEGIPQTYQDALNLKNRYEQPDKTTGKPKYQVGDIPSVQGLTDNIISGKDGGVSNMLSFLSHDGYQYAGDKDIFLKNGTINKQSEAYQALATKVAPLVNAKATEIKNIPAPSVTKINNYNQEKHDDVIEKYNVIKSKNDKGIEGEFDAYNSSKINVPVGNTQATSVAINPVTKKATTMPDLANATVTWKGVLKVDKDGNLISKGDKKTLGFYAPMVLITNNESETESKEDITPQKGDSTQTASDPFGTQKTPTKIERGGTSGKLVQNKYYVPLKDYQEEIMDKYKISKESFDKNYLLDVNNLNKNIPKELQSTYEEYYQIGGSDKGEILTNAAPSGL